MNDTVCFHQIATPIIDCCSDEVVGGSLLLVDGFKILLRVYYVCYYDASVHRDFAESF